MMTRWELYYRQADHRTTFENCFNHLRLIINMKAVHLPSATIRRGGEKKCINKTIFTFNCTNFCLSFAHEWWSKPQMRKFRLNNYDHESWFCPQTIFFSSIDDRFSSHEALLNWPAMVVKLWQPSADGASKSIISNYCLISRWDVLLHYNHINSSEMMILSREQLDLERVIIYRSRI